MHLKIKFIVLLNIFKNKKIKNFCNIIYLLIEEQIWDGVTDVFVKKNLYGIIQ